MKSFNINKELSCLDTGKVKRYCRFDKFGIKYVDYKDVDFLHNFINQQGKILPRRITCNRMKWQKEIATAVKRARFLALLPYVTDQAE